MFFLCMYHLIDKSLILISSLKSSSLSLITASNTKHQTIVKTPTEGSRKVSNQNGSDSEKSSGGVGSSVSMSPTQNIRTTKASRLRAAALGM